MKNDSLPVTCNTAYVGQGSTFVAIKGSVHDGNDFIDEAIARGASLIVSERLPDRGVIPQSVSCLIVPDARKTLADLSAKAWGYPASSLTLIGVTGTAGKSTTTFMVYHILKAAGYTVALSGGVHHIINDTYYKSGLTTPSSDHMHAFFARCRDTGVTHVVMEVSSHSLALDRVYGLAFDVVAFTNLSAEHLDFHGSLDHYFSTKKQLFNLLKQGGVACINRDDAWGVKMYEALQGCHGITLCTSSLDDYPGELSVIGLFNKSNAALAVALSEACGVRRKSAYDALASFDGVPGRMQMHTLRNGARVCIDFAHKPRSFEVVMQALRPLTDHLIVVFGCGGQRDAIKRPIMGMLAHRYADFIIVTDDNPRFEDPQEIVHQIMQGIAMQSEQSAAKVIIEHDRRKAIAQAISFSRKNSIIALLGKGHETEYLVQGKAFFLSDYEEIKHYC